MNRVASLLCTPQNEDQPSHFGFQHSISTEDVIRGLLLLNRLNVVMIHFNETRLHKSHKNVEELLMEIKSVKYE